MPKSSSTQECLFPQANVLLQIVSSVTGANDTNSLQIEPEQSFDIHGLSPIEKSTVNWFWNVLLSTSYGCLYSNLTPNSSVASLMLSRQRFA